VVSVRPYPFDSVIVERHLILPDSQELARNEEQLSRAHLYLLVQALSGELSVHALSLRSPLLPHLSQALMNSISSSWIFLRARRTSLGSGAD
jgi:hypothetical protein